MTLNLDTENIKVLNSKGLALGSIYRYEESYACFDKALKLDPNNAEIWVSKGLVLGKNNRSSEAIKHFDKALKLDPDFEPAQKAKILSLTKF